MSVREYVVRADSMWDEIAADPVARESFLEEYQGLAVVIGEQQTDEEWVAESVEAWTYRPPVVGLVTASLSKSGPPDLWWGCGPGGQAGRAMAPFIFLAAFIVWLALT